MRGIIQTIFKSLAADQRQQLTCFLKEFVGVIIGKFLKEINEEISLKIYEKYYTKYLKKLAANKKPE